jgi:hypothetical protein
MSANPSEQVPAPQTSATVVRSVVTYRLGGREYPLRSEPKCLVCQSPHRVEIERGLLRAYSPTSVYRTLPEQAQASLSVKSIGSHARQHMPVDHVVRQAFIRERTEELGKDYEEIEGSLVDGIVFARTGLQKVYEDMMEGKIQPDVKDGIAFAQFLSKAEDQAGGDIDLDVAALGFMEYLAVLRAVCTPEQIQAMAQAISESPTMSALRARGEMVQRSGTFALPADVEIPEAS